MNMLTKEYAERSFLSKQWFAYWAGMSHRSEFYVGWKLAEGAALLAGLGFNGKTEEGLNKWNRLQNVNLRQVEFGGNLRTVLSGWNMNTVFLRTF